jgi:hypothetical protein
MSDGDRDELSRLTREISAHLGIDRLGLVDFSNSSRGTAYQSFWDMPDSELLATAREFVQCLKSPVLAIPVIPTAEEQT